MSDLDKIARLITGDPDIFTSPVNEAWGRSQAVEFGWTAEEVETPWGMLSVEYEGTAEIDPGDRGSHDTPPSADSVEVTSLRVMSVTTEHATVSLDAHPSAEEAKFLEDYFYRHIANDDSFYEYILNQKSGHDPDEARYQRDEERWGSMGRGGL